MRRAAVAALLLGAAAGARAQPYDPSFRWRTLETPRFRVHFHQGEEALAQDVAREAERAHALLAPRLGWAPRRTEIVLSDDTDDANGLATPLPYNTIRLYAVPPPALSELHDYRDWLRQLVQHEYAHVVHLDMVGGLPALVNRVFGKLWPPNGLTPSLLIEGLAVVNESEGDPGAGRNASALFDMEARALALDGPFPRLDEASNPFLGWPLGDVPYLLGGRFMGFLQARYGPAAIAGFTADQGAAAWPWSPSWAGRRWFGEDFDTLWAEYAALERAHAEGTREWVRRRPVTQAAPLTRRGGRVERPRFSPDGSFVAYQHRGLDEAPGIYRVAADGRELGRVAVVDANGALALRTPREAIAAIGEVYREHRVYDDLYRVELETGRRRRLTRGERAREPDVGPDGTVVYVRHTGGGGMALVRRRGGGGAPEVLFAREGAQVYGPRLARDGRIAFELHEGGRRDVAVWSDGRVARVTDDDALDTGLAWTPDGRHLLFASDRGGIFNLYAWDPSSGAVRQVTNVELGAFQPDVSPDGKTIVFVGYSRAGFDLATIPLDEASWLEPLAAMPAPGAEMASGVEPTTATTTAATATANTTTTATATTAAPTPTDAAEPLPSRPYSAWHTLGPTFWLPIISSDGAGTIYGALTGGVDVLARHAWAAQGWWSAEAREPGYALSYQGGWSWPRLDLSSLLFVDDSPGLPSRLQRVHQYADAGATFTFTRLARALALRVGWSGTGYESIEPEQPLPPGAEPFRFRDGLLSEASLQARYSDARRFTRSISPEEGRTVALGLALAAPELGSDYSVARARASVAQYLRVPYAGHTVLALRAAGGVADGTIGGRAPFELGGVANADLASLLPGATFSSGDQLRGYPNDALGGTGYVLANVELRFPLAAPTRGRSTWPIFLRRVHGALFVDAGDAFDLPGELPLAGHALALDELRAGVGVELRLEVVLGYYLRTDVRFGVARGLGAVFGAGRAADRAQGIDVDAATAYLTIGPSF